MERRDTSEEQGTIILHLPGFLFNLQVKCKSCALSGLYLKSLISLVYMPAIRRLELPHSTGAGFAGGIVPVVFGRNGRTSTGYVQLMLAVVVSSIGTPCFSQVLQADSVTSLQHHHLSRFTS